jgi:glycosyltransferase involved in cell wall biosynthesis
VGPIVIQQGQAYRHLVDYLVDDLGFKHIGLPVRADTSIRGKLRLLWGTLLDAGVLLRRRRLLAEADDVVVFAMFSTVVKLLARLRLIRYRRLFCFGFFIHSPSWFPVFRLLARLDSTRDHYILFSEAEIALYAEELGIDARRMHYLPYGDWRSDQPAETPMADAEFPAYSYYFAGGYSNRDYRSLIEAFRHIPATLLIACSTLNRDVDEASLPANIKVVRNVPSDTFDTHVKWAKACIIPLKNDTGASGQSVMLRLMRNGKVIIASDVSGLHAYVANGVSGYLVRDMARELPGIIAQIEADPDAASLMGKAAYARYCSHYSRAAVSGSLRRILT